MRFIKIWVAVMFAFAACAVSAQTPTNTPKPTATATKTSTPTATLKPTSAPAVVKGAADGRKAVLDPTLVDKQNQYFIAHGKYFQGLAWSPSPATDGDTVTPNLALRPSYQLENWATAFPGVFSATEPSQMYITQYVGPKGKGYVVCMRVKASPDVFERCDNFGPEKTRTTPWTKLVALP